MKQEQIAFKTEAREKVRKGIDMACDAVRITLGASGRNVLIAGRYGAPKITNDGGRTLRELLAKFKGDKYTKAGISLVKQVSDKTNEQAGDASTTTPVIYQAFVNAGMIRLDDPKINPAKLRKQMIKEAEFICEKLKEVTKVADETDINNIAITSIEDPILGKQIADIVRNVGVDGIVSVQDSQSDKIEIEMVKGMRLDRGYISKYCITNPDKAVAEYEDIPVLITPRIITSAYEIVGLIDMLEKKGIRKLAIICTDMSDQCLAHLAYNKGTGKFMSAVIKAPYLKEKQRDFLEDVAVVTGGTSVTEDIANDLNRLTFEALGHIGKLTVAKDHTDIVDGAGDQNAVKARVDVLKSQMATTESALEKVRLEERIAKLSGGVSIVRIGTTDDTDSGYLRDKVDDAINAVKSAMKEGIVAGGGTALARISHLYPKELPILGASLIKPMNQIMENSGLDNAEVDQMFEDIYTGFNKNMPNAGFDALENDLVGDMIARGIVDPVLATRLAVMNSAVDAGIFITTDVAIVEDDEDA